MQLILARTAYCDTEQPQTLLTELGFPLADKETTAQDNASGGSVANILKALPNSASVPIEHLGGLDQLEPSLRAADRTQVVAFYTPPEQAIAHAIADSEVTVEQAAARWTESAKALLHAIRRNRKRVTLFEATAVEQETNTWLRILAERLNIAANETAAAPSANESKRTPDPVLLVIAHQAVAQSPELQDLHGELEASAQPLGADQPADPDCENALQELRARDRKQEEASQTSEENGLLLLQLHQVQEELETYYLELQKKKKEKEEQAFRRRQLERTEERMRRSLEKTRRERDQARENVRDLKNSTSWRWTKPLRAINAKLSGKSGSARKATSAKA